MISPTTHLPFLHAGAGSRERFIPPANHGLFEPEVWESTAKRRTWSNAAEVHAQPDHALSKLTQGQLCQRRADGIEMGLGVSGIGVLRLLAGD